MLSGLAAVVIAAGLTMTCAVTSAASQPGSDPIAFVPGGGGAEGDVLISPRDAGHGNGSSSGRPGAEQAGRKTPGERTCANRGEPIDCTNTWGVWWPERQCWVERLSPQPPADDPLWEGNTTGAVYWCQPPPMAGAIGGGHAFWAPAAGQAGAPVLVDPVTLAEQAIERMNLRAIHVGITPPEGPDTYTLLGLPTWMWVEEASPTTWGPITDTASAGSVTVTASARVRSVVWDMGDGTQKSCGKGTPYDPSFDAESSPTCGHRYETPGRYPVTATSHWTVDWSGAGQSGTITFTLTRDASVWVRQAHGLVSRQG
ncbi:MAG: hypothetical protein WCF12_13355 [Propionicimonas sp.]